jgi:hypothetical protein
MDADLKWNGSLRDLKGITFFVREFRFSENDLYLPLFRKLGMLEQLNNSMKNTSFFTWQGNSYEHATTEEFSKLRKRICDSVTHLEITNDQRDSFLRISEQLAISLLIPDEVLKGKGVPHIRDINGNMVSYVLHVAKITPVLREKTVHQCDLRPQLHKSDSEI